MLIDILWSNNALEYKKGTYVYIYADYFNITPIITNIKARIIAVMDR